MSMTPKKPDELMLLAKPRTLEAGSTRAGLLVEDRARPSGSQEAWASAGVLAARCGAVPVDVAPLAWGVFRHPCLVTKAAGNDVPDAFLAAVAIGVAPWAPEEVPR